MKVTPFPSLIGRTVKEPSFVRWTGCASVKGRGRPNFSMGMLSKKTLKSFAPPVLVHDDVQRLLPGLLLQQESNLELESVSDNPYVEEWCGPQIAGYEHLERLRKAGVSGRVEGIDHDRDGALRMVENIPDTFGSEGDMGARVVVTPWSVGNST